MIPNPVIQTGHAAAQCMLTELVRNGAMSRATAERFASGLIAGAAQFLASGGNELFAAEVLCQIADEACLRVSKAQVGQLMRPRA